jgi:hypothetical protein
MKRKIIVNIIGLVTLMVLVLILVHMDKTHHSLVLNLLFFPLGWMFRDIAKFFEE